MEHEQRGGLSAPCITSEETRVLWKHEKGVFVAECSMQGHTNLVDGGPTRTLAMGLRCTRPAAAGCLGPARAVQPPVIGSGMRAASLTGCMDCRHCLVCASLTAIKASLLLYSQSAVLNETQALP